MKILVCALAMVTERGINEKKKKTGLFLLPIPRFLDAREMEKKYKSRVEGSLLFNQKSTEYQKNNTGSVIFDWISVVLVTESKKVKETVRAAHIW